MTRNMHMATLNNGLAVRLVVAYKQIPDAPLKALVINVDKLVKTVDRDELLVMVQSPQAAQEKDFINVLNKKGLLEFYHKAGYFEAVSIDDVIMAPDAATRIPLRTVINEMNKMNGVGPLPTPEQMAAISQGNPHATAMRAEALLEEGNHGIAKTVLVQAKMMQDEANKKFAEALRLDPSLGEMIEQIKSGSMTKPIVLDVSSPQATAEADVTKAAVKGRNRKIRAATK